MPVVPYALAKASVNGGAASTGGLTGTSGQSVQLSADAAATLGASAYKWELYDYPEGYAQPSGWSTASDGSYYYLGATPPVFNLPTLPLWGKVMIRLTVNDGDPKISGNDALDMMDTATAVQTLSSNGLEDIAFDEVNQFNAGDDVARGWIGALRRTLRTIDGLL